jgi:hypothetical protein
MKKIGIVLAALVIVTFMVGTAALMMPALAKAETVTTNVKYPVVWTEWVPCAMGGAGESIVLYGVMHEVYHTTLDGNGGFHAKMHTQPQRLSGTGLTSGDKYQGTGVTQDSFNGKVGETYTFVNNYRMIGQGPGNNLLIHVTSHYTVNANGDVTAEVDNIRIDCK